MATQADKSMPISKSIELGGKTYVIQKMHVGKYTKMLLMMDNLPAKLMELYPDQDFETIKKNLGNMSAEDMIRNLPKLMQFAANEVIGIISFATGVPKEVFEYHDDMDDSEIIGLDDMVDLIEIVVKLNNFNKVADSLKNLMALKG